MIPTLILVGLVAGGLLGHHRLGRLVAACAVASLLLGLVVGVGAGSATTFLGATALAAVNVAGGAVVGIGVHRLFRASVAREVRA